MTGIRFVIFIVENVLAALAVYAVQIPVRKKAGKAVRIVLFAVKLVLWVTLAFLLIGYASYVLWHGSYLFAAFYNALFGDLVTEIIYLFVKKKKHLPVVQGAVTAVLLLYGMWNMQTIRPAYHTYTSDKLDREYKIVYFADLHYGSSQTYGTVQKAFDAIKAEQPDYLLLVGDIVDEHTKKEEMQDVFQKIADIGVDTYYVYGNHDRQERGDTFWNGKKYTEQELADGITSQGIKILYNEFVQVEDDLVFLGMEDPSHPDLRIAVEDLPERPKDAYVVALEHTPYQNDDIRAMNADLQISGHTHAGQLFPLKWMYTLVGLNVYGDYQIEETRLFVSAGITGWYLPYRNEEHCNYEVITLKPE